MIQLAEFASREAAHARSIIERGSVFQRERIGIVAERAVANPGDLIEIGCYSGGTSRILAEIARRHGRKLVCVDNWQSWTVYDLPRIGTEFCQWAAREYPDTIAIYEGDAHSPEIVSRIQGHRYCFAFSDDGHSYEEHLSELRTLLPLTNGPIAVDDVYLPDVRRAIADATHGTEWVELYDERLRESWLVKR